MLPETHTWKEWKFFLIPPESVSLYVLCDATQLSSQKHGLAVPFFKAAERHRDRVHSVADADIVLVPALVDWFSRGLCRGTWDAHLKNLTAVIAGTRKPTMILAADFLSNDHSRQLCKQIPRLLIGNFMKLTPCSFLVGYMNHIDALNFNFLVRKSANMALHWDVPRPKTRWHIEFTGQVDRRKGYRNRYALFHTRLHSDTVDDARLWITTSTPSETSHVPPCTNGSHLQCYVALPTKQIMRVRLESNFSLMLRGDDETSDRLQNAFVLGSVPVVLGFPTWLPFSFVIPWRRILVSVSFDAFVQNSANVIPGWRTDLHERQKLIRAHKADLMFSHPRSRLVGNILRAAAIHSCGSA